MCAYDILPLFCSLFLSSVFNYCFNHFRSTFPMKRQEVYRSILRVRNTVGFQGSNCFWDDVYCSALGLPFTCFHSLFFLTGHAGIQCSDMIG